MKHAALFLTLGSLLLSGCGGGGGSSGGNAPPTSSGTSTSARISFALTDAPVDNADAVVVMIDSVTLRREGGADVFVDRFTIPGLGLVNADTFQIDLLDYRNGKRLLFIDDLVIPAGRYSQIVLNVLDENIDRSYVDDSTGRNELKVPSDGLKLGGFTTAVDGVYTFTLDFDLRKAMTYNPGPDRYILKPRGVRIVDSALAATLDGRVDPALFNTTTDTLCSGKTDPLAGNAVYLYAGAGLASTRLGDAFDPTIDSAVPADIVEPYAISGVTLQDNGTPNLLTDDFWAYNFGYVPAGTYTLAFTCNALGDDPEYFDEDTAGPIVPRPPLQYVEVQLASGASKRCDLPVVNGNCSTPMVAPR